MKKRVVSISVAAAMGTLLAIPSVQAAPAPLNFNAIDPCRVLDTRESIAGSKIGQGVLSFSTNDADFSDQGGNALGCGLPAEGSDAAAVALTITTTQQDGNGHLQVFSYNPTGAYPPAVAYPGDLPNASVLNYKAVDIANSTIVAQYVNDATTVGDVLIDYGSGATPETEENGDNELSIYTTGDTHIIVDVIGYYTPAVVPPL